MVNFTDINAQCTITTARINDDPYTEMKDPSCYLQLNLNGHATLTSTHCPCKGTRPSQLMAKVFSLMPGNALTNTTTKNSGMDHATSRCLSVRFSTHFFTSINPIWVGDLRTGEFFYLFFEDWQIFAILYFLRTLSVR